jgi:hypothetical protein
MGRDRSTGSADWRGPGVAVESDEVDARELLLDKDEVTVREREEGRTVEGTTVLVEVVESDDDDEEDDGEGEGDLDDSSLDGGVMDDAAFWRYEAASSRRVFREALKL